MRKSTFMIAAATMLLSASLVSCGGGKTAGGDSETATNATCTTEQASGELTKEFIKMVEEDIQNSDGNGKIYEEGNLIILEQQSEEPLDDVDPQTMEFLISAMKGGMLEATDPITEKMKEVIKKEGKTFRIKIVDGDKKIEIDFTPDDVK